MWRVEVGDCRRVMADVPDGSVDSVVCDPPYELGFMGKSWDASGVAYDVGLWGEVLRVLKPGGHLLAFGGSRTYHRLACAVEDAGFEIRDQIMWVYGSGFPKSLDVAKAIDKSAGAVGEVVGERRFGRTSTGQGSGWNPNAVAATGRQEVRELVTDDAKRWEGWGTALKPAHEPIVVARKPLVGTVAANVLAYGTGGLNIDGCRIPTADRLDGGHSTSGQQMTGGWDRPWMHSPDAVERNAERSRAAVAKAEELGRWPANLIHDGSDEVLALFPDSSGGMYPAKRGQAVNTSFASGQETEGGMRKMGDSGSAARFFYCAKTNKKDRDEGLDDMPDIPASEMVDRIEGSAGMNSPRAGAGRTSGGKNNHPTVKPTELMRYLCRLVTPPNGTVLDPFCGSGSTGKAAVLEGFNFVGIEQEAEYADIAKARIRHTDERR